MSTKQAQDKPAIDVQHQPGNAYWLEEILELVSQRSCLHDRTPVFVAHALCA